jgi:hypothetical protein
MAGEDTASAATLPEGDQDPNAVYIAVGRAIHSWEELEQALAYLYLKMVEVPDTPSNLAAFGSKHRTFAKRMAEWGTGAWGYFIRKPDQKKEGRFNELIATVNALSLERHRVAHGHVSIVAELHIPKDAEGETFNVEAPALYRWAAPFYATGSLKTDPFGKGSKDINLLTDAFIGIHNEVHQFTEAL